MPRTLAVNRTLPFLGTSLAFNGSNTMVNCGIQNPGTSITVGGWVKWTGHLSSYQCMMSKDTSYGSTTEMWQFYLDYLASDNVSVICGGSPTSWSYTPPSGIWTHLATTFVSGSAPILYVNGNLFGSASISVSMGTGTTTPIFIGSAGASGDFFSGKLDEMFILNAIGTQADINNMMIRRYAAVSNKFALWSFDEGSGTIAIDSSGTNTGTITNATYSTDVSFPARTLATGRTLAVGRTLAT